MAASPLQNLADVLAQHRTKAQVAGCGMTLVACGLVRWLAPQALAAQLAAALPGLALCLFAWYFGYLQKLRPEDRKRPASAGIVCLVLCVAAALGAAGISLGERGTGPAARSGATEAAFAADNPNRVEIRLPAGIKRARKVVVRVEKIWTLEPEKAPTEPVDLAAAHDVALPVKATPFSEENNLLGQSSGQIVLTLQPTMPSETATQDVVDSGSGLVRRYKFKQARDYVFLLRLTVFDTAGKKSEAGELLYLPDLKTSYTTPTSAANRSVLREIQASKAAKSRKLANLLSANALLLESKK
jgi:hypothetical protein